MKKKHKRIKEIVEKELSCSAHDIDHVMRVYHTVQNLSKNEHDINTDILTSATLLHDIARVKEDEDKTGKIDHAILGAKMAEEILLELGYSREKIEKIKHCIIAHRFRGNYKPITQEAKLLFDADKLDVLGSIGIARSFIIAGQYKERLYSDVSIEEYVQENLEGSKLTGRIKEIQKHSPNLEFSTKFIHIKDKLYTSKAKKLAGERLEYMKTFFDRLKKEISGEI